MTSKTLVNTVKTSFIDCELSPNIRNLRPEEAVIDNGFVANDKLFVLCKEASEKCTKDSYAFNFYPQILESAKKLALTSDVIFEMRCANDEKFCALSLDELLQLQDQNGHDKSKQLVLKIDLSNRSFTASLSGGKKKIRHPTGLFPKWVKALI